MSYQHQLVAEIWKQLQERRDVPNILREVLGQHVYDCACLQLADKSVDSIEQCMRTVVWIKCIFDLQRSYLQATHGIHDSPPEISQWLLPVDTVFTVLIQLVSVKCRLFPSVDKTPKPFLKHRIFLFQSLLSGLRLLLLLLQSEDFERERLITLRQTIENAWNGSTFTETEAFWLLELFPNTTEAAQNPYGAWMAQETIDWEYMGVPKYKEGLSTLSLNPMKLVSEVFKALKNREATWLQTYWLLFDLLWAMESAIVQLYVEASRSDSGRFGHATTFEDTQSTLLETRKILIAAIFRIPRSEKTFSRVCVHRSLTTSLLCWQILDSGAESDREDQHPQDDCQHLFEGVKHFTQSLSEFAEWLRSRNLQISSAPFLPQSLSSGGHRFTVSDYTNPTSVSDDSRSIAPTITSHSISNSRSSTVIETARIRVDRDLLVNPTMPFPSISDAHHPNTRTGASSESQRPTMFAAFRSAVNRRTNFSRQSDRNPATDTTDINCVIENNITNDPRTPSLSSGKSSSKDRSSFPGLFTFSSKAASVNTTISNKEKAAGSVRPDGITFSSDGTSVVFWGKSMNALLRFDLSAPASSDLTETSITASQKWSLPHVALAAAGNIRTVALVAQGERRRLAVFYALNPRLDSDVAVCRTVEQTQDVSLAVSRDDKFAAIAINDRIQLYQLSMGYIRRVKVEDHIALYQEYARKRVKPQSLDTSRGAGKLTSKEQAQEADALSTIVERRLFFSPNSDKLVCATLLGDQHVYLDAWDVRREPSVTITHAPRSFRLPPWTTNDGGLENVFFSPATNGVIFTAFISKEYPVHIPIVPRGNRADEDGDIRPVTFGTKVITAAQSPSGEKFVLANGINELVLLGFKAGGQLAPRRLKNGQAKMVAGAFRHGHVALGMPSDEDVWVLACSWKESGAKMMLRAVKVSVDGETYNEVDIRERFEAVMKEEVEEIVLEKSDAVPPVWDVEAVMLPERHSRAEARIETPTPTPAMDVSGMMMQFDGGVDVPATGSFR